MKTIPFPKEYKRLLRSNRTVIVVHKEQYKKGQTYEATDQGRRPFNIKIKVLDVIRSPFKKAKRYVLPYLRYYKNIKDDDKVNIIKLRVLNEIV